MMDRINTLKDRLTALFRSGADEDHNADEMLELLDGLDFHKLMQAIMDLREPVYEYRIDSELEKGFSYRGPELIPGYGVLLYTDFGCNVYDAALHEQAFELWLLMDASFAVLSRVRTTVGNNESIMEYRTIKGMDWKAAGMSIDFLDLADDLERLCEAVKGHELPLYEL